MKTNSIYKDDPKQMSKWINKRLKKPTKKISEYYSRCFHWYVGMGTHVYIFSNDFTKTDCLRFWRELTKPEMDGYRWDFIKEVYPSIKLVLVDMSWPAMFAKTTKYHLRVF